MELTVIGDAVNLAAKLEKHNKTEGTRALTSATTFAQAEAQGYVGTPKFRAITSAQVAGVALPINLVALA